MVSPGNDPLNHRQSERHGVIGHIAAMRVSRIGDSDATYLRGRNLDALVARADRDDEAEFGKAVHQRSVDRVFAGSQHGNDVLCRAPYRQVGVDFIPESQDIETF